MERIAPIGKLNLKLQYETQIHVIIVMHVNLLKELYQLHLPPSATNPNNNDKEVALHSIY